MVVLTTAHYCSRCVSVQNAAKPADVVVRRLAPNRASRGNEQEHPRGVWAAITTIVCPPRIFRRAFGWTRRFDGQHGCIASLDQRQKSRTQTAREMRGERERVRVVTGPGPFGRDHVQRSLSFRDAAESPMLGGCGVVDRNADSASKEPEVRPIFAPRPIHHPSHFTVHPGRRRPWSCSARIASAGTKHNG
jgi:hypothetical protein